MPGPGMLTIVPPKDSTQQGVADPIDIPLHIVRRFRYDGAKVLLWLHANSIKNGSIPMQIDPAELRTFKQYAQETPAFPVSKLRYLWFQRFNNGIAAAGAMVKMTNSRPGARKGVRMVHKTRFDKWTADKYEV